MSHSHLSRREKMYNTDLSACRYRYIYDLLSISYAMCVYITTLNSCLPCQNSVSDCLEIWFQQHSGLAVLSCFRMGTKAINCLCSKLLDLTWTVCTLTQPWGPMWIKLFWTLALSDLLVSVIVSVLGFFSDEPCFFFFTQ